MEAIVLTYDENHKITEHMIIKYLKNLDECDLTFVIPYNKNYPRYIKNRFGQRVKIVSSESPVKKTVKNLLKGIPNDEWVYWAMDDKYPVDIKSTGFNRYKEWLINSDTNINGLSICRTRKILTGEALTGEWISGPEGERLYVRSDYSQIWLHQFIRAGSLKRFIDDLPQVSESTKELDTAKYDVEFEEGELFVVTEKNHISFGESTTRGKVTKNCYDSIIKENLSIPSNLKVCNERIRIGSTKWTKNLAKSILFGVQTRGLGKISGLAKYINSKI
jgi:hypothetical protein